MHYSKKAVLLVLYLSSSVYGQYFNERVLEKSFEITDFFFAPSYLNPYGLEGFGSAAVGLIDDPLLNLQINPAYLVSDIPLRHYIYINFRNSRSIDLESDVYPLYRYTDMATSSRYIPYPYHWYFVQSRKVLEPVFSGAYFVKPLKDKPWVLGLTYQTVFQEEDFYEIPQDIYRDNPGYDFSGNRMAESSSMPVIDRYSGENSMYHEGHFISLFSSFRLMPKIDFGLRLSAVYFNRDGAVGSTNNQDSFYSLDNWSKSMYLNERSQDYDHLDGSAGVNVLLTDNAILGVSAGYLKGKADQTLGLDNDYESRYGTVGTGTYWSYYLDEGFTRQTWNHDGGGLYGGVNLMVFSNSSQTLNLFYQIRQEKTDIELSSTVDDTSNSSYYSEWYESSNITHYYSGDSHSRLTDIRTGSGEKSGIHHRFGATFQYKIDRITRLHLGALLQLSKTDTKTAEDVINDRYWYHHYMSDGTANTYNYAMYEDKTLNWEFQSDLLRFQIPIFMFFKFSPVVELVFGMNRDLERWMITDETLAIIHTRTNTENGQTRTEGNFGERYIEPKEKRSDVSTTLLGGLILSPSEHFSMRFLFSPRFKKVYGDTEMSDMQWWIDFNVEL